MFIWNGSKRGVLPFNSFLDHLSEFDDFCGAEVLDDTRRTERKESRPCIASDDFSNDMGFCLNMTLPFFNSARGFFAAKQKKDASE